MTKSGIMLGLGEERDEVEETIRAIRAAGTDILTVGQYLRPSPQHLPVRRYYTPQEFAELRDLRARAGLRARRIGAARALELSRRRARAGGRR